MERFKEEKPNTHEVVSDTESFFNRDAQIVAKDLLGKVLQHRINDIWVSARIIETEAYYNKNAIISHSFSKKKKLKPDSKDSNIPTFKPGILYMYFAHGGDSLNFSCGTEGHAVLIKSGYPASSDPDVLQKMRQLNPTSSGEPNRPIDKLCNGQTLFCKSIGLKVKDWDGKSFDPLKLRLLKSGHPAVTEIIQTTRLGITPGHSCNEYLEYRFIEADYVKKCTKNPLTIRNNPPSITRIKWNECT